MRSGMDALIVRLRRMIDDKDSKVWDDDELIDILDSHRVDFYMEALTPVAQTVNGVTTYTVYSAPYQFLEEYSASDSTVFRLYNSLGESVDAADYTPNYSGGVFTFIADQQGKTLYLDGRSYDLNGAAADCWREAMGSKAKLYSFATGNASYNRSDWFKHCGEMVDMYKRRRRQRQAEVVRA